MKSLITAQKSALPNSLMILMAFGIQAALIQPAFASDSAPAANSPALTSETDGEMKSMKAQLSGLTKESDELSAQKQTLVAETLTLRRLPRSRLTRKKVLQLAIRILEISDQSQVLRLQAISLNHRIIMTTLNQPVSDGYTVARGDKFSVQQTR